MRLRILLLIGCFLLPCSAFAVTQVVPTARPVNVSATGLAVAGAGTLTGIFCASGTGTIKLWDAATATGKVIANTFTPVPPAYFPMGVDFQIGLFITITGTSDCTLFVSP